MTLPIPITVRLKTASKDSDVTAQISDITYRSTIPGGFAACTIALNRPITIQPDDIALYGSMYVYDGRNGRTLWEGRVEDPGRSVSNSGQVWQLSAVGPMAHATDRTFPIVYVDTSLDRWERSQYSTKGADTITGEIDSDTPCLISSAPDGTAIPLTWASDWIYRTLLYTGQFLGRARCNDVELANSVDYQVGMYGRIGNATGAFFQLQNWSSTAGFMAGTFGTSGWISGINNLSIAAIRNNTTTTANAATSASFYNVVVRAAIKNADGTDITSAYTGNTIDPAEVVTDLLGRYLTKYDGPNANVNSAGTSLDQCAYPDGVTCADIFNDMSTINPAYYWAAWETTPSTGKWRFEYVPWPTTIRYDADTVDGFDSPGSATDLYNAAVIRWLDAAGKARTTRVTNHVQVLSDAGLTREAYIDLGDELGTSANAGTIGFNFLQEHQYPPNAGTLTVARPIADRSTGRMVQPWEILPGGLIRVRGVLPRVDSLNPTARDGVTVFRVLSVDYASSTASATLELDSYTRSVSQQLANLKNKRIRKR